MSTLLQTTQDSVSPKNNYNNILFFRKCNTYQTFYLSQTHINYTIIDPVPILYRVFQNIKRNLLLDEKGLHYLGHVVVLIIYIYSNTIIVFIKSIYLYCVLFLYILIVFTCSTFNKIILFYDFVFLNTFISIFFYHLLLTI